MLRKLLKRKIKGQSKDKNNEIGKIRKMKAEKLEN